MARIAGRSTPESLPLVLPSIVLTAVFSIIGTLQLFSEPTIVRTLTNNVTIEIYAQHGRL